MGTQPPQLLINIASKLGVNDPDVLTKACTYFRTVTSKQLINMNEILKSIICLEMATQQLGVNFDKTLALKLSVVSKPQYQKNYNLIKNVLQIETCKSIHEICIQLSCEEASKTAEKLLNKYKENDTIDRDFNHPQYAVAAVYTICRLHKISVKKSDFITMSTLKPQQWTKLETEFIKFAEENDFKMDTMKKTTKKKGNEFMSMIEEKSKAMENKTNSRKLSEDVSEVESYEAWRKRILAEAYEHLNRK